MERETFKILFFVQKSRVAKNGEIPVLLRVTVNGERAVSSINLKVDPVKWNAVAGKSIGNTRKDDEVNARIDTIRAKVMKIHRQMELDLFAVRISVKPEVATRLVAELYHR